MCDVDSWKWRLGKVLRRLYGDNQKLEVEHKTSCVYELKRVAARVEQARLEGDVVIEHDEEGQNTHTATPAPARTANRSQLGAD